MTDQTAKPERHYLAAQLARELNVPPRSLRRILETVKPVGENSHGWPLFRLVDVQAALAMKKAAKGSQHLRDQKLSEEIRRLKFRNDIEAGRYILSETVLAQDRAVISRWNTERVRFEQEWPPMFDGKTVNESRELVRSMMDRIGDVLAGLQDVLKEGNQP